MLYRGASRAGSWPGQASTGSARITRDRLGPRGSARTARSSSRACCGPTCWWRAASSHRPARGARCGGWRRSGASGTDPSLRAAPSGPPAPAIIVDRTTMSTFYRLLGFLRPYKRGVAVSWRAGRAAMVMTVLLPYLTGLAVEAIKHGANHARLARAGGARPRPPHAARAGARDHRAVLVRWVLTYMRRMIAGRISLGIEYDLRELLYGHLQRLELGFFDRQQTGQLMSRGDRRPAGGALLPRLRARVHPAVGPHDPARRASR